MMLGYPEDDGEGLPMDDYTLIHQAPNRWREVLPSFFTNDGTAIRGFIQYDTEIDEWHVIMESASFDMPFHNSIEDTPYSTPNKLEARLYAFCMMRAACAAYNKLLNSEGDSGDDEDGGTTVPMGVN